jgi:hypothetical protein
MPLPPAGWAFFFEGGEIENVENGETRCKEVGCQEEEQYQLDEFACFKHSQSLEEGDVWRMKVVEGMGAFVGFATESYNAEKHWETIESSVWVVLSSGTTAIHPDASYEGWVFDERGYQIAGGATNVHYGLLYDYTPKTFPYDLALRINKDGNMPQLRCNEDGEWHDFAPEGETGLKAGPWFPFLLLWAPGGSFGRSAGAHLSDHRVNRPRPVKGAGMKKSLPASAAPASESAGAAAVDVNEAAPPAQKKARQ